MHVGRFVALSITLRGITARTVRRIDAHAAALKGSSEDKEKGGEEPVGVTKGGKLKAAIETSDAKVKEIEQEVNDFSKHINPEMDSESLTGKTNETETKDWQKRDAFVAPVRQQAVAISNILVMPWLCVSIYRAFYPSPYYKEEEEGGRRGALSAEDAALVKRGQIVIGLMGAFGFFVECIGSAIHFSWVDNALDAPIIHLVIMHLGKAIILIAGMVLIGLMPAGFDFDEHLATWLCDVYNGWVFYMHRSAICSPFVHINALYATTDLLGEPARQACDEHIRSPTRWVLLSVPILISGLAYLQMLIINWTKVPVPGWPRPSTLFVAFHFATVTTTMYRALRARTDTSPDFPFESIQFSLGSIFCS
jgi:hypothetical protein